MLIVTAEASYHAGYDECTKLFLERGGVHVDHAVLAEHGIRGNAHMMMLEKNSDAIAALIADWTDKVR